MTNMKSYFSITWLSPILLQLSQHIIALNLGQLIYNFGAIYLQLQHLTNTELIYLSSSSYWARFTDFSFTFLYFLNTSENLILLSRPTTNFYRKPKRSLFFREQKILLLKDTLKAFDNFKNRQQRCMK